MKEEDQLDLSEVVRFAKEHDFADIQTRHGYEHLVLSLNLHNPKIHKQIKKIMSVLR